MLTACILLLQNEFHFSKQILFLFLLFFFASVSEASLPRNASFPTTPSYPVFDNLSLFSLPFSHHPFISLSFLWPRAIALLNCYFSFWYLRKMLLALFKFWYISETLCHRDENILKVKKNCSTSQSMFGHIADCIREVKLKYLVWLMISLWMIENVRSWRFIITVKWNV